MVRCSVCQTEPTRTAIIEKSSGKLLLTEFNRILSQKEIISLRLEENMAGTFSVLAELQTGEILTVAVVGSYGIARRLSSRLRKWLNSNGDFPFHVKHEIYQIVHE